MSIKKIKAIRNSYTSYFLGFALILMGIFNCDAWSQEPYKIGVLLPLSGHAAYIGESQMQTLKMMEEDINNRCGINQRKIKLLIEDTGSKEQVAFRSFQSLLSKDVISIIGPSSDRNTHAIMNAANNFRIPIISLSPDAKLHGDHSSNKWVFKTAPKIELRVRASLINMMNQQISEFVLSGPSGLLNNDFVNQITNEAQKFGINISRTLPYTTDLNLDQIKQHISMEAQNVLAAA